MITFDKETCSDLETGLSKEWLETNGLGGFASSTIPGSNTRRYHSILTAALPSPLGRMVLVNSFDESITFHGKRYEFSCHQYPGDVRPKGHQYLTGFRLDPWPVWTYTFDSMVLEKSLTMIHGQNTVITTYKILQGAATDAELTLRPFLTGRNFHALHKENSSLVYQPEVQHGVVILKPYEGLPAIFFHHNAGAFKTSFNWYRQLEYLREKERGLEFQEDWWSPGEFFFTFERNADAILVSTTEGAGYFDSGFLLQRERQRRRDLLTGWERADDVTRQLVIAADQFVVCPSGSSRTLIAGYPWFEDWGRDTFIALPGLLLTTGRFEDAKNVFRTFVSEIRDGMVPNRFPDFGRQPDYNTVDASLWFIVSVFHYLRYTKDFDFVLKELWPKMREIMDSYQNGTRYNIHMDIDGLIVAHCVGAQLTWMDVKIGDWVVTPRYGKPVEVQALWYNALRIMEQIAKRLGDKEAARQWSGLSVKVWNSINQQFWYAEGGYLFDVVHPDGNDASFRPNQIMAVSLPFESITSDRSAQVVNLVEERLLTPFGLRSLDPRDPRYASRYQGDMRTRDVAYHQGTAWPWLMGPFLTAFQKVHGKNPRVQTMMRAHLALLLTHLWEAGLGTVSEIFEGDMPHEPRGCIAQAWSVGEILRLLREDLEPGHAILFARKEESSAGPAPAHP